MPVLHGQRLLSSAQKSVSETIMFTKRIVSGITEMCASSKRLYRLDKNKALKIEGQLHILSIKR